MTIGYLRYIRRELPKLINNSSQVFHYKNDMVSTLDTRHFKRQMSFHLYSLVFTVLNSRDIWTLITDILFNQQSKTLLSILLQISPDYQPNLLAFLTTETISKQVFYSLASSLDMNLILYKPQLCPDYVVRLEDFNIDLIMTAPHKPTWVIYTEPVDCLLKMNHLGELTELIQDPAIDVNPVVIKKEFLLSFQDVKEIQPHFLVILYKYYYRYTEHKRLFDLYRQTQTSWNAIFQAWGGKEAVMEKEELTIQQFVQQCYKISTSVNGIVSVIYQDSICHISQIPSNHYFICTIGSRGIEMAYIRMDQVLGYKRKKLTDFVAQYGQIKCYDPCLLL